jgi:hypothetical protein
VDTSANSGNFLENLLNDGDFWSGIAEVIGGSFTGGASLVVTASGVVECGTGVLCVAGAGQIAIGTAGTATGYGIAKSGADKLGQAFREADDASSSSTSGASGGNVDKNAEYLRDWAKKNGLERKPGPGPETWGVTNADGSFEWRLKIKLEPAANQGLQADSYVPRADARLMQDPAGQSYINPFTGQVGNKKVGTHIPLDQIWP